MTRSIFIAVFAALSIDNLDETLPPFPKWLSEHDSDGDGRLSAQELPLAGMLDSSGDGFLDGAVDYTKGRLDELSRPRPPRPGEAESAR